MIKVNVWVEAMDEVRKDVLELNMTLAEWDAMTDEERSAFVEEWAYNEVQMGYGYDGVSED